LFQVEVFWVVIRYSVVVG